MTKKILFIITQSEFGGAQRFLANLTASLDKNKYNILVAAGPEGDNKTGLLSFLDKKGINTRRLKYLRRAINPFFDFLALRELRILIKNEKPKILFLCSSKAGLIGSLASRLTGVSKIIYRIGGWAFNDPRSFLSKAFYKFIEKVSAKWKDIIIVNSEHDRKQAISLGIKPKNKLVNIYNGIDASKLKFLSREKVCLRQISRRETSSMIIGTIANLYPTKGLEYLIEAAKFLKNKNYKFVVIGEGSERKKLENLIKKYKLETNFFLVGAFRDAHKYLKAFDVFVLPSVKEGFPWVILEAMVAGVPIVATKVGAVPEILEHKKTGFLVEPKKPEELSKAIAGLISNKSLGVKLSNQARKIVEEEFSLNKMVSQIEKLL